MIDSACGMLGASQHETCDEQVQLNNCDDESQPQPKRWDNEETHAKARSSRRNDFFHALRAFA
jgi:hypothetical protein